MEQVRQNEACEEPRQQELWLGLQGGLVGPSVPSPWQGGDSHGAVRRSGLEGRWRSLGA